MWQSLKANVEKGPLPNYAPYQIQIHQPRFIFREYLYYSTKEQEQNAIVG
jgi:hypothetical protein